MRRPHKKKAGADWGGRLRLARRKCGNDELPQDRVRNADIGRDRAPL